jgi:hypothetical protein
VRPATRDRHTVMAHALDLRHAPALHGPGDEATVANRNFSRIGSVFLLRCYSTAWPRVTGHTLGRKTQGFTNEPRGVRADNPTVPRHRVKRVTRECNSASRIRVRLRWGARVRRRMTAEHRASGEKKILPCQSARCDRSGCAPWLPLSRLDGLASMPIRLANLPAATDLGAHLGCHYQGSMD